MGVRRFLGRDIIERIEEKRGSKVIAYFTGDRPPFSARIAEDAVRPLYDHLLALESSSSDIERIDLFLYSGGGDVSVPWRIVSMIREFCREFNVLIPYKALSAATLIALGADRIVMGRKAELGPIDPTLVRATPSGEVLLPHEVAVEDVNSFLSFIRESANIVDRETLSAAIELLVREVGALTLGKVIRAHHHIRLIARKLLTARKEKMDEEKSSTIIETLTEKIYFHGHGMARREAREIGLPVEYPDGELEKLMWSLYLQYEDFLKLREPLYPELVLGDKEEHEIRNVPIAVIESSNKIHVFRTNVKLRKKRRIPPDSQVSVNLALHLPSGITPQQIPEQMQQILDHLSSQVAKMLPEIVRQEMLKQSLILGLEVRVYGGKWVDETP